MNACGENGTHLGVEVEGKTKYKSLKSVFYELDN